MIISQAGRVQIISRLFYWGKVVNSMQYFTPEQISKAKEVDLLTYLQHYEPQELVHVGGSTYCTREHDSLKISNGKWHWFSHGFGGVSALDYLIKVKGYPFLQAVEVILGRAAALPPVSRAPPKREPRKLLLPERNDSADRVKRYLMGRGIHPNIIDYCLERKLLFESEQYHNAVFVGYDREGQTRYAALRGTKSNFKSEATGSDKHFSFSIPSAQPSEHLHLFESAIDLLSYATLALLAGQDWRKGHLLSLADVFKTKRKNVVPVALAQYLQDHPQIKTLHLHLDNDEVGRGASKGILGGLGDSYVVLDQPPPVGKDMNELLQRKLGQNKQRKEWCR